MKGAIMMRLGLNCHGILFNSGYYNSIKLIDNIIVKKQNFLYVV
jgi:hypothetical protein